MLPPIILVGATLGERLVMSAAARWDVTTANFLPTGSVGTNPVTDIVVRVANTMPNLLLLMVN